MPIGRRDGKLTISRFTSAWILTRKGFNYAVIEFEQKVPMQYLLCFYYGSPGRKCKIRCQYPGAAVEGGGGSQVNKFEQVSSDDHQLSVAAGSGRVSRSHV